ncbi:MAG: serine hydrolase domain-containing protein [Ferruginibacter sp.]
MIVQCSCSQKNREQTATNADSTLHLIKLPEPAAIPKATAEHITQLCQAYYDSALKPKGFNGGIIVAKGGNILFEKYTGTGHIPGNDLINANTPFQVASVSKTFTAMAVLKLVEEGKINLDDELSKYMPKFNYPGVTVRTLLDHRSGIPNYTYFMQDLGWDVKTWMTNLDMFQWMTVNKSLIQNVGTPNTRFAYSNTNYALLAILIRVASGKEYADYLQEVFFGPLQMKNTFVFTQADTDKVIPSYDWKGRLEPFNFLDAVYGDKNIYTTCRDLLTWDRALKSGLLFKDATLKEAYTPYSNERPGVKNYGLGWHLNIYPNGKKMIFHNGWWHGNNAVFIRLLDEDATIILTGNKYTRAIYHARELASIFGDYDMQDEEDENGPVKPIESATMLKADSLQSDPGIFFNKKPTKKDLMLKQLLKDKHRENMQQQSRRLNKN